MKLLSTEQSGWDEPGTNANSESVLRESDIMPKKKTITKTPTDAMAMNFENVYCMDENSKQILLL